jgi:hypothetical protein
MIYLSIRGTSPWIIKIGSKPAQFAYVGKCGGDVLQRICTSYTNPIVLGNHRVITRTLTEKNRSYCGLAQTGQCGNLDQYRRKGEWGDRAAQARGYPAVRQGRIVCRHWLTSSLCGDGLRFPSPRDVMSELFTPTVAVAPAGSWRRLGVGAARHALANSPGYCRSGRLDDVPAEHHGAVFVRQVMAVADVGAQEGAEVSVDDHRLRRLQGDHVLFAVVIDVQRIRRRWDAVA